MALSPSETTPLRRLDAVIDRLFSPLLLAAWFSFLAGRLFERGGWHGLAAFAVGVLGPVLIIVLVCAFVVWFFHDRYPNRSATVAWSTAIVIGAMMLLLGWTWIVEQHGWFTAVN